jgi:hypothetical protein
VETTIRAPAGLMGTRLDHKAVGGFHGESRGIMRRVYPRHRERSIFTSRGHSSRVQIIPKLGDVWKARVVIAGAFAHFLIIASKH